MKAGKKSTMRTIVDDANVRSVAWFKNSWLDKLSIDPKRAFICRVTGKGMEPTLMEDCSILVDRNRRRRRPGRIFVMRTEDGLVVKRAGKDNEGNWRIESENPAWPPVPWSDTTEIIGEVRWYGVTL